MEALYIFGPTPGSVVHIYRLGQDRASGLLFTTLNWAIFIKSIEVSYTTKTSTRFLRTRSCSGTSLARKEPRIPLLQSPVTLLVDGSSSCSTSAPTAPGIKEHNKQTSVSPSGR